MSFSWIYMRLSRRLMILSLKLHDLSSRRFMTFAFTYMFLTQEIDELFLNLHTFFQEFDKLHLGTLTCFSSRRFLSSIFTCFPSKRFMNLHASLPRGWWASPPSPPSAWPGTGPKEQEEHYLRRADLVGSVNTQRWRWLVINNIRDH